METKLYIIDSSNTIRVWSIKDNIINHGIFRGKQTKVIRHISSKEAEKLIKDKVRAGYRTFKQITGVTEDNLHDDVIYDKIHLLFPKELRDNNNNLNPMKCQPYRKGVMKFPVIAQPKLNGIRCVAREELVIEGDGMFKTETLTPVLRSKKGLVYVLPHITKALISYFQEAKRLYPEHDIAFDGELYVHDWRLNRIKSAVPYINEHGTISKSNEDTNRMEFHVFDLSIPDVIQSDRELIRKDLTFEEYIPIKNVRSSKITNEDDVRLFRDTFIENGYEGVILRDLDAYYEFGRRPATIMKYKKVLDNEFVIVDVVPKDNEPETGMFVCRNDINDELFTCNPEGTFKERKDYLDNKSWYIGKLATVKYYERSGVKQVPFHANVVTIRDYEG